MFSLKEINNKNSTPAQEGVKAFFGGLNEHISTQMETKKHHQFLTVLCEQNLALTLMLLQKKWPCSIVLKSGNLLQHPSHIPQTSLC